jgi:hypothetical protein
MYLNTACIEATSLGIDVETGRPVGRRTSVANLPPILSWPIRLKRIGVLALITIVTFNLWTGSPLVALWLGSRVQGSGRLTMLVVAVVVVAVGVLSLALVRVLNSLTHAYDRLTGRPRRRRETAWLRSRDVERLDLQKERGASAARLSPVDVILVLSVVVPFVAFEIWFFFYASDPIPKWAF